MDDDDSLAQEAYDLYPDLSLITIARRQKRSHRQVRADIIRLGRKIRGQGGACISESRKKEVVRPPKCIRCYLILEKIDGVYPDLCPICIEELRRGVHYVTDYTDTRLRALLMQWGFL